MKLWSQPSCSINYRLPLCCKPTEDGHDPMVSEKTEPTLSGCIFSHISFCEIPMTLLSQSFFFRLYISLFFLFFCFFRLSAWFHSFILSLNCFILLCNIFRQSAGNHDSPQLLVTFIALSNVRNLSATHLSNVQVGYSLLFSASSCFQNLLRMSNSPSIVFSLCFIEILSFLFLNFIISFHFVCIFVQTSSLHSLKFISSFLVICEEAII